MAEAGGGPRPPGRGTRCDSSGPHWPRTGHGTGCTGLAGAARHGGKHRDAGRHRAERERLGRSRAGNQCRFRASTGHHAADYADYARSAHPPRVPGRDEIPDCDSATGLRTPAVCAHQFSSKRSKLDSRKEEETGVQELEERRRRDWRGTVTVKRSWVESSCRLPRRETVPRLKWGDPPARSIHGGFRE